MATTRCATSTSLRRAPRRIHRARLQAPRGVTATCRRVRSERATAATPMAQTRGLSRCPPAWTPSKNATTTARRGRRARASPTPRPRATPMPPMAAEAQVAAGATPTSATCSLRWPLDTKVTRHTAWARSPRRPRRPGIRRTRLALPQRRRRRRPCRHSRAGARRSRWYSAVPPSLLKLPERGRTS